MPDLLCVDCTEPATTDRMAGVLPASEIEGRVEDGWVVTELVCSRHGVQ